MIITPSYEFVCKQENCPKKGEIVTIDMRMSEYTAEQFCISCGNKCNNYSIASDLYHEICKASSQIAGVKYNPYRNYFQIWTNDNFYWEFGVYRKEN